MPTIVEIGHVGEVEFPDSMTAEEITAASKRLYDLHAPIGEGGEPLPEPKPGRLTPDEAIDEWLGRRTETRLEPAFAGDESSLAPVVPVKRKVAKPQSPELRAADPTEERIKRLFDVLHIETRSPQAVFEQTRHDLAFLSGDESYLEKSPEQIAELHPSLKNRLLPWSHTEMPMSRWSAEDVASAFPVGEAPSYKTRQVIAGTQNAVADLVDFFTSPLGVATLAGGGVIGASAGSSAAGPAHFMGRAQAAYFANDMLQAAPEQTLALLDAIESGDRQAITRAGLSLTATPVFLHGLMKHAATPYKVAAKERLSKMLAEELDAAPLSGLTSLERGEWDATRARMRGEATPGLRVPAVRPTAADRDGWIQPVTEPWETLRAQVELTLDPESPKAATHFTDAKTAPAEVPEGLVSVELPEERGVLFVNPAKADPLEVAKAAMEERHGKFLGMGSESKPENLPKKSAPVVEGDPNASPLREDVARNQKRGHALALENYEFINPTNILVADDGHLWRVSSRKKTGKARGAVKDIPTIELELVNEFGEPVLTPGGDAVVMTGKYEGGAWSNLRVMELLARDRKVKPKQRDAQVVQTRTADGTVVQDEVVTAETRSAAEAAGRKLAPEGTVELKPAEDVIAERAARITYEEMSPRKLRRAGVVRELNADEGGDLIRVNGQAAGWMKVNEDGVLEALEITPEFQRKGIARRVVHELAKLQGRDTIKLFLPTEQGQKFFGSLGDLTVDEHGYGTLKLSGKAERASVTNKAAETLAEPKTFGESASNAPETRTGPTVRRSGDGVGDVVRAPGGKNLARGEKVVAAAMPAPRAVEQRQQLLERFRETTEAEVAKHSAGKAEISERTEDGVDIIEVGNEGLVSISREEGQPWRVYRDGEFSHVYSHEDKAKAIERAVDEWRELMEERGYKQAAKVYEANPEQTIYEMHKHLDLPRGWKIEDTAMSKSSTYFMVKDARGNKHKLRISDHEPSVFREQEFGGNDAVFYAKPMTPETFAAAMIRVEDWMKKAARESGASGKTSSQPESLKTAGQTSISQKQGASAVPATESRMVASEETKAEGADSVNATVLQVDKGSVKKAEVARGGEDMPFNTRATELPRGTEETGWQVVFAEDTAREYPTRFRTQAEAEAWAQDRRGAIVEPFRVEPWHRDPKLAEELRAVALYGIGGGHRFVPTEPTLIDSYVVFRGELEPPSIKRVREVAGGDASRISNSIYPIVELQLSNGAVLRRQIRISDHGQVSRNAPREYSHDVRWSGKTHSGRNLVKGLQEKIKAELNDQVAETWEAQREILEKANAAGEGGVAEPRQSGEPIRPERAEAQADKSKMSALQTGQGSALTGGTKAEGADSVNATVEQATLPRRIEAPKLDGPEPVSLASIREYLSSALDIPVRMGTRVRGGIRGALGLFMVKAETIRMKALNDIPTLAHEVGHYLHYILFPAAGQNMGASNFAKAFDAELMKLGARTSRPTYTEHQVRKEGVAEFVREWMTDRTQALAKAPTFTAFFESQLQGQFPEVWKIVNTAREQLGKYINQPAQMKIRSMISRNAVDPRLPITRQLEKFYTNWVNDLAPIERAMQTLQTFGLPKAAAKAVTDFAVNHIGGWRGKVEYSLWRKQIDLHGNEVGPGLRDILAKVENLDDFRDFLVANRALELAKRGKKTGIDFRDAAAVVSQLGVKYEPVRLELLKYQRQQLQLLVDAGVLSAESFARMDAMNRDYVPFYRVYERVANGGGDGGKGFVNLGQGVHAFKGSDRQIIDPLESIVKNGYVYRELAERNEIGRLFVEAVEGTRGGGRVAESIAKKMKPTQVTHEEVVRTLKDAGIDVQGLGIEEMDLAFKVWRAGRQPSAKDGHFTVWKNGKEQVYQLGDAELHRALTLADAESMKISNGLIRALFVWPTQTLRAGATLTLEFMARNPFRDQVTAGVFSKHGFVPFFDGFRGLLSAIGRNQWYYDWIRSGGRYSDFVAMDRTDLQHTLADVIKVRSVLRMALELAHPRNVLQNLRKFSELTEQATRIAEYRRAIEGGASRIEAANASKDVTLNFARAGRTGRAVNQLVAFFNASVQDLDKFVRAHRERPFQTTTKALMYITVPSVLTWYLGKDDKEIQNLPEWRRNFFWNINLRSIAAKAGMETGDFILSFPKPFLLGQIYGSSVERGLDYATKRDPNAVQKWFSAVLSQSPLSVQSFMPTATRPLIETMANYSFFRGQPIENQSMQALPADLRFTPNTSIVARKLGAITPWEMSPAKWDNAIRGYLGGLGKYGTDAADWLMMKSEVADVPAPAQKTIWERPLLRGFVRSPYEAGAYLERFYKSVESAEQRINALKKSPELMSSDEQKEFFQGNAEDLAFYVAKREGKPQISHLREFRDRLGEVNKAMVTVQQSRELKPAEKADRLKKLARLRDDLAEIGFKTLISPSDQRKNF